MDILDCVTERLFPRYKQKEYVKKNLQFAVWEFLRKFPNKPCFYEDIIKHFSKRFSFQRKLNESATELNSRIIQRIRGYACLKINNRLLLKEYNSKPLAYYAFIFTSESEELQLVTEKEKIKEAIESVSAYKRGNDEIKKARKIVLSILENRSTQVVESVNEIPSALSSEIDLEEYLEVEDKISKPLLNKDNITIPITYVLYISHFFLMYFDNSENPIILEILLIIIFVPTFVYVRKHKIKKHKLVQITFVFIFIILTVFNIAGQFRKSFSIEKIQVVESDCLWENELIEDKGNKEVIGFSEKTKDVWVRWRKYPKLKGKDTYYDNTPRDKKLRIVYNILNKNFKNINAENNNKPYLTSECNNNYLVIADSSYKDFFRRLIESYRGHNNMIECIKSIWPRSQTLNFYNRTDEESWLALSDFQKDFFREKYPIFAIELKNDSNKEVKINRASVEMKDLIIDMHPKDFAGGRTLEKLEHDYNWVLSNLNDPKYEKWLEDSLGANPYGYSGVYNSSLDTSYFDLEPSLLIYKESTVLIHVRIKDGYRWPCKIRINFYDSDNNKAQSRWYSFNVTSHPSINLYKFEKY